MAEHYPQCKWRVKWLPQTQRYGLLNPNQSLCFTLSVGVASHLPQNVTSHHDSPLYM